MPHEVLQCIGIHSRFCHIRAICVSAYMRCDVWHLHPVDIIVSANHMIEAVLPVHCHKWHSIIIVKQESAISVYGFFYFGCISVLDDCLKHLCHILCNRQHSCSCIRLCGFYDVSHIRWSLQLMVDIHSSVPFVDFVASVSSMVVSLLPLLAATSPCSNKGLFIENVMKLSKYKSVTSFCVTFYCFHEYFKL